eukprot:8435746-Pyramimonas_sp.AAC.1
MAFQKVIGEKTKNLGLAKDDLKDVLAPNAGLQGTSAEAVPQVSGRVLANLIATQSAFKELGAGESRKVKAKRALKGLSSERKPFLRPDA